MCNSFFRRKYSKIAFVFPGQGAQFGMGKDIYENNETARQD